MTTNSVAEEAGQHGRPDDRVVLLEAEDVDRRRQREAAGRQRDAAHDVEADPDPPRVHLREVGGRADAEREPVDDERDADDEDQREDGVARRQQRLQVVAEATSP